VVILPKTEVFPDHALADAYTKYLIAPIGSAPQDTVEVQTSIYQLTDKVPA